MEEKKLKKLHININDEITISYIEKRFNEINYKEYEVLCQITDYVKEVTDNYIILQDSNIYIHVSNIDDITIFRKNMYKVIIDSSGFNNLDWDTRNDEILFFKTFNEIKEYMVNRSKDNYYFKDGCLSIVIYSAEGNTIFNSSSDKIINFTI
ncbi:MAG: hypothetical protein LBM05_00530 [Endomicrobium sp.]|jgi:hypothetical protein|nr:hypothetical protein [Endomicrobium sp.]